MSINDVIRLRRDLHRHPELSGSESRTAGRIIEFFEPLRPDDVVRDLGGHGVAFVFAGAKTGPTVMLRCELDALPIRERADTAWRSATDGVSHQCGHDGHMAVLAAVGRELAATRPRNGNVVLLYQPAEETGRGASAVLADARFERIRPDYAFAAHNLPGFPLGRVVVRAGAFACASRGIAIRLTGAAAHASQPETGRSPAGAMCRVIERLSQPSPDVHASGESAFVTVVGSRLGEKAFGTAPGNAEVWATLRSETDETMKRLVSYVEQTVRQHAAADGLAYDISSEDRFEATVNSPDAVEIVRRAAGPGATMVPESVFPWSEDFGRFSAVAKCALFGIGAGENTPQLHHPDYDFPEALIRPAADLFVRIIHCCLS